MVFLLYKNRAEVHSALFMLNQLISLFVPRMLACLEVCTDLGDTLVGKLVPDQRDAGNKCEDRGQHVDHEIDAHLSGCGLLYIGDIAYRLKEQDNRSADRGCKLDAELSMEAARPS